MFRGRRALGQYLTLSVRTLNSSGEPVAPDACPLLDVWTAAGVKVRSLRIPIEDAGAVTGYFSYRLHLGPLFATGQYIAVYHWKASSHSGMEVDQFEVLPGHGEGAVIAATEYVRPHARFLVHQLDSGKLKRGRNPRV